jgi:mono/diheme cytochrome c family protein
MFPRVVLLATALAMAEVPVSGRELLTPPAASKTATRPATEQVRAFLNQHCLECHGAEKPKGKFRVDKLSADFRDQAGRERWLAVLKRVQAGEMPLKAKPRPPASEITAIAGWIRARAEAAEAARRAAEGRVVLRRLNRAEYENTVRDLLGVDVNVQELLALDGSMDGFDNVGAALHLSSFAMERYLEAADTALTIAIVNRSRPATQKKRYSLKDQYIVHFKDIGRCFRIMDDAVVSFASVPWTTVSLSQFYPHDRGHYRIRISACGFQTPGKPVSFHVSGDSETDKFGSSTGTLTGLTGGT